VCEHTISWGCGAAQPLPRESGTYALLLRPCQTATLALGRLGQSSLAPGVYVYAGSALGPGGIRARVTRHLRQIKPSHWHIDAFTSVCPVESIVWIKSQERLECTWAQALLALPGASAPIPGFGSTDCCGGCPAHLIKLASGSDVTAVATALEMAVPLNPFLRVLPPFCGRPAPR
jgi:Uri superfamily endonuclease